jgi:hypothetical protein
MNLKELRQQNLARLNNLRRVHRLVETEVFGRAWVHASPEKQREVKVWIHSGELTLLELWVEDLNGLDLETMSLRQLRKEAMRKGVHYYCRKSKFELVWELINASEQKSVTGPSERHPGQNGATGD